ncbi:lipocalin family protein [uncultured Winogradskyella sp.]|uniref:lipocalin family protein n=1 Tax=uncultured Winogradskyella sp. TaxID=395353 RepID=UPI00262C6CA2|nr:lipocalin family protein [uncultured Winogradskyella sp.]
MKTKQSIKQLLLLCVVGLTAMACPNDDGEDPTSENPIVGTWRFLESFENGVVEELEPCDTEGDLIFAENGNFSGEYYVDDNEDGICELEEMDTGSWSNTGNLYTITIGGESETQEITFEGNTFFFEETDVEDGVTITYRDVFIKQ